MAPAFIAALPIITAVTAAVGTAYGIYAQQQASSFQKKMAARNAEAAQQAARDAAARGLNEGVKVSLAGGAARGALRAGFGASGIVAGSGSSLDVLSDAAMFNELDKETAQSNAEREAFGFRNQAGNFLLQSRMDSAAARSQSVGTLLSGASSIGGNYYSQTH